MIKPRHKSLRRVAKVTLAEDLLWLSLIKGSNTWPALGQSFLDGKYDPFGKHKLQRRRHKPGYEACHLLRREDLCSRCLVRLALLALLWREGTPAGGHRPRIQHDRPDAVILPFVGQRFGEAREAKLGGAVGRGARPTLLPRYRRDVDNRAAARLAHRRKGSLGQQERSPEVYGERSIPALYLQLLHRTRRVGARSIDQHVYAAKSLDSLLDGPRRFVLIGQICGQGQRLAAGLRDLLLSAFELLLASCHQCDVCASPSEGYRRGPP